MKTKFLCLLALVLVLVNAFAFAEVRKVEETDPDHAFTIDLPEEYTMESAISGELSVTEIRRADGEGPVYELVINHSELYDEMSMGDIGEEDRSLIVNAVAETLDGAMTWETRTLPSGLDVLVICENDPADYADLLTVFDGYFFEMHIGYFDDEDSAEQKAIAQEDIGQGMDFYSALGITEVPAK